MLERILSVSILQLSGEAASSPVIISEMTSSIVLSSRRKLLALGLTMAQRRMSRAGKERFCGQRRAFSRQTTSLALESLSTNRDSYFYNLEGTHQEKQLFNDVLRSFQIGAVSLANTHPPCKACAFYRAQHHPAYHLRGPEHWTPSAWRSLPQTWEAVWMTRIWSVESECYQLPWGHQNLRTSCKHRFLTTTKKKRKSRSLMKKKWD